MAWLDADITAQVKILENQNATTITEFWDSIPSGTTSGTLSPAAGHEFVANQWEDGVDAIVTGITGGVPNLQPVYEADGITLVTATLNTATGAYVLSGEPAGADPVALVTAQRVTATGLAALINAAAEKTVPIGADKLPLTDSEASGALKHIDVDTLQFITHPLGELIATADLTGSYAIDFTGLDPAEEYTLELVNPTSEYGSMKLVFGSTQKPGVLSDPSFDNEPGAGVWGYSGGSFSGGAFTATLAPLVAASITQIAAWMASGHPIASCSYECVVELAAGFPADLAISWTIGDGNTSVLAVPAVAGNNQMPAAIADAFPGIYGVTVNLWSVTGGTVEVLSCRVKESVFNRLDGKHWRAGAVNGLADVAYNEAALSSKSVTTVLGIGAAPGAGYAVAGCRTLDSGQGATPTPNSSLLVPGTWRGDNCDSLRVQDYNGLTQIYTGDAYLYKRRPR